MTEDTAIDNYLVWQLCKQQENIQEKIMEDSVDGRQLKEVIEKVREEYREQSYSQDEKLKLLERLDSNPDYRLEIYQDCSWSKETVKVEDLGTTLPRLGEIPPEIITGRLSNVVEFVDQADPEEYRNVKYIKSLEEIPEIIEEFYPWVVAPGNRPSKRDRLNKVHGEKDWDIADTWGMINDGNHRAIAKVLANKTNKIECFVGRRSQ